MKESKQLKQLLELKQNQKAKKPDFTRQDSNIKRRFVGQWRAPKGLHSKQRLGKKGHKASPAIGYGSPKIVKGLNKDGLREIIVNNLSDLSKINPKIDIAVLSATIGLKKKIELVNKAKELKLAIANVPNIDEFLTQTKVALERKKEEKKKKKTKREKAKEEAEKRKKEEEKKKSEEEKKKEEEKAEGEKGKERVKEERAKEEELVKKGKVEEKIAVKEAPVGAKTKAKMVAKPTAPKAK